jgi:hypothetical protein
MNDVTPPHFYKYRSLSDETQRNRLRQIFEGRLYLPRADQFNDPFDCAPVPVWESTRDRVNKWAHAVFKRRTAYNRKERRRRVALLDDDKLRATNAAVLKRLVNDVGIFSLSARCDHILMWSHYSDSHAGICLRFASGNRFFGRAFPVKYQRDRPRVDMLRGKEEDRVRQALLTKAAFWEYEEEWRIIEMQGPGGPYQFPPEFLDGVILGPRISDANRAFIMHAMSERATPTEVLAARVHPEIFGITIGPVGAQD